MSERFGRRQVFARGIVLSALALLAAAPVRAGEVRVAVAANFTLPMKQKIIPSFEQETRHTVLASYGPTGGFYTQIMNGAPFDVFLSADAERPLQLEGNGTGVKGTRFTFAVGKVVLWSAAAGLVDDKGEILRQGKFAHLAIPNPKIAPYGMAARQALQKMNLWQMLEPKVVYGQDLNQTFQMIATGNAELGFVALSQLKAARPGDRFWSPPADLYAPIRQDAILLARAKDNAAARAFLAFLKTPRGLEMIESFGYGVE